MSVCGCLSLSLSSCLSVCLSLSRSLSVCLSPSLCLSVCLSVSLSPLSLSLCISVYVTIIILHNYHHCHDHLYLTGCMGGERKEARGCMVTARNDWIQGLPDSLLGGIVCLSVSLYLCLSVCLTLSLSGQKCVYHHFTSSPSLSWSSSSHRQRGRWKKRSQRLHGHSKEWLNSRITKLLTGRDCLSVSLCVCVCLSLSLCLCRSVGLSVCLSVSLSVSLARSLSLSVSVSLSLCALVCMSASSFYITIIIMIIFISQAAWEVKEKKPEAAWPQQGMIEFKDYQTRYRERLSVCMSLSVSFCLSLSLSVCLCLPVSVCLSLSVCLCVCLFLSLSLPLCVCVSVCVCVCVRACMCVNMSVCGCLSLSLSV